MTYTIETLVSMIPFTDWKRWIWPWKWPHRCPSKGNTTKWVLCLHTSLYQIKHKDTIHTSQLSCLFCPWIPPNPHPNRDTNKHACKQTGRQANRAYTHKLSLSGARHENVPAVLSPGKPSQDKPNGGSGGPAEAGAPGSWSHMLLKLQRVKCRSYSTDAARSR